MNKHRWLLRSSPSTQSGVPARKQPLRFPTSIIAIRIVPQRLAQNLISQVSRFYYVDVSTTHQGRVSASSVFCDRPLRLPNHQP